MPDLCWLLIGDGRDEYHEQAHASALEHLPRAAHVVTIDDRNHDLGFAGAIAEGWRKVRETGAAWVFHLEMDFTFNAPVPLEEMIAVLKRHPYLVQMALKRQPVNPDEKAAGGIVEQDPDSYVQRTELGAIWTEHRKFFTTNPSVYPAALCAQPWPQEPHSEGLFSHKLFADPKAHSAFWGGKFDAPLVTHIGDERQGRGY